MSRSSIRERFINATADARSAAVATLSPYGDVSFTLTELSNRAFEAADRDWEIVFYDWRQITRNFNDPDRLDLALWHGDRLLAMCIATTTGDSVFIQVVEGDPDDACPLAGARLEILLAACANYAQIRGKKELRLEPKNEKLIELYESVYRFERVNQKGGAAYWRLKVV